MRFFRKHIFGNGIFAVVKISSFRYMMLSEFFSQLAFHMQHFVLIFIIYGFTKSNTAISLLVLSFALPAVLFSLISGVYVDRWSKKKVLYFTNIIRGILLLPFLIPDLHLGYIYILTFLIAVATQFFIPAETAIIPTLVPKKLILSANAVFSLGIYSSIILGFILAGPMLLLIGKTYSIIFLIVCFFISTFFVFGIKIPHHPLPTARDNRYGLQDQIDASSLGSEVKEIFNFIRQAAKVTHALIVLTIAQAAMFMLAVLGPGYVSSNLGVEIESLSWIIIAPAAVGLILGAFLIEFFGKKFKAKTLGLMGFVISGISFILFPLGEKIAILLSYLVNINIIHIVVVLAFVVGFAIALIFVPSHATIQTETSEDMRGRVYGFLNALVGAVSLLPVIIAGGLADLVGVGTVITASGILAIIVSVFLFFLE